MKYYCFRTNVSFTLIQRDSQCFNNHHKQKMVLGVADGKFQQVYLIHSTQSNILK